MRGNSRQLIYLTDIDRGTFMGMLRRTIVRHGWDLHGYCLMDNHFHLLVQTAEPTISTGMCYLNSLYARRFNNRHGFAVTCSNVGFTLRWSSPTSICASWCATSR